MRILAVTVLLAMSACAGDEEIEGDDAGECSDGADNDQDAYFDCDDNGCWNSPDCDGGETDTDTDADSDSDSDADADSDADSDSDTDVDCSNDSNNPFNGITGAEVEVTLAMTLTDGNAACDYLEVLQAWCDCEMTFVGSANTLVETCGDPYRVTLDGTFSRTASTCDCNPADGQPGNLEQGLWSNLDGDDSAYLTFGMNENFPQFMDFFTAHEFLSAWAPPTPTVETVPRQFAVYGMQDYVYSSGQLTVAYSEEETPTLSDCPTLIQNTTNITFSTQ